VGRRCYIGWPFLIEAVVTRVVDGLFGYRRVGGDAAPRDRKSSGAAGARMVREPMEPYEVKAWPSNVEVLERTYARRGIITGPVNVILTVRPIKVRCHDGRTEIAHTVELTVGSFFFFFSCASPVAACCTGNGTACRRQLGTRVLTGGAGAARQRGRGERAGRGPAVPRPAAAVAGGMRSSAR